LEASDSYSPSSASEVEASNPIKLRVVEDAPSFGLPQLTGQLGLRDAVQAGIKNNLTLKESEQTWMASKFLARSAFARFGPASSAHTWYSASSLSQMLFLPVGTEIYPTTMQPIVKGSSLAVLFAGTQPIYTGGRLMGPYRAARAREHQSLFSFHEDRLATALAVKEAYWNAAWSEAKLRVDTDYVKFREWSSSNMKERLLKGNAPKADYLREEAELAKARVQVNEDYRSFNTALLNLKVAMGLNVGSQVSLRDSLEYVEVSGDVSTYLVEAQPRDKTCDCPSGRDAGQQAFGQKQIPSRGRSLWSWQQHYRKLSKWNRTREMGRFHWSHGWCNPL